MGSSDRRTRTDVLRGTQGTNVSGRRVWNERSMARSWKDARINWTVARIGETRGLTGELSKDSTELTVFLPFYFEFRIIVYILE